LISRTFGNLFQFAFRDVSQLLCSLYSGCVPVEVMTEVRALFFGQKVGSIYAYTSFWIYTFIHLYVYTLIHLYIYTFIRLYINLCR
jgi:hypothetical protein